MPRTRSDRAEGGCDCEADVHLNLSGVSTWSTCGGVLTIPEFPANVTGTYFGSAGSTTTTAGDFETPYCIDGNVMRLERHPRELGGFYSRQ